MKTRRVFLTMVGASAAAAACADDEQTLGQGGANGSTGAAQGGGGAMGAVGGSGQGAGPTEGPEVVADLADLVEGELFAVPAPARLFLGLDVAGVYAMTSLCTHNNCDMVIRGAVLPGGGRRCTCHSSRFDVFGEVTMGPALTALRRYHVAFDGTAVVVDKSMVVDADFRAPLPMGAGGMGGAGGVGGSGGS